MKVLSFVRGKIEGCIRQDEQEAERLEAEAEEARKEAIRAIRKEALNAPEAERILATYKKRDDLRDKAHALRQDAGAFRRLLGRVFGDEEVGL